MVHTMTDATSADLDNEENESSMMAAMKSAGLESMIEKEDSVDDVSTKEEIEMEQNELPLEAEEEDFGKFPQFHSQCHRLNLRH